MHDRLIEFIREYHMRVREAASLLQTKLGLDNPMYWRQAKIGREGMLDPERHISYEFHGNCSPSLMKTFRFVTRTMRFDFRSFRKGFRKRIQVKINPRTRLFGAIILAIVAESCLLSDTVLAHEGWGIVVNRQGQIYFSDIPTNTIWRITREGKPEAFISNKHSHALVLGEDGSIYGTQEHHAAANGSVWRIAPDGSFSNVFTPAPGFPLNLHPFIIDRDGNIYSTNSISFPDQSGKVILLRSTPDGSVTVLAGSTRGYRDGRGGEAQFSGIDGMAWAADGSLYVTDGVYVRRVTMDGVVTTLGKGALTIPSYGEDLMGLAVSPNGIVYVADYSQRRVLQLMPDGSTRTVLETGLFWSPTGITIVGEDLYVLEHLRMPLVILGDLGIGAYARVRKISDGRADRIATVWGRNTLTFAVVLIATGALLIFGWRFLRRRKIRRSHRAAAA